MGWMEFKPWWTNLQTHPDWFWDRSSLHLYGYQGCYLEVEWLEHGTDHSPPSSAEVYTEWSYTSTLPCAFMACKAQLFHFFSFLAYSFYGPTCPPFNMMRLTQGKNKMAKNRRQQVPPKQCYQSTK
jgi:hypothetical protein